MYRPSVIIPFTGQGLEKPGCLVSNKVQHVLVGKLQGFAATRSKGKVLSNLIFVASTTSGACGEKICHVEKFFHVTDCHVEIGEVSLHDKCLVGDMSPHGK